MKQTPWPSSFRHIVVGILLSIFVLFATTAHAAEREYYTLQLATFAQESNSRRYYESLRGRMAPHLHAQVRVERIGNLYAFRLGACTNEICLETLREMVSDEFPNAQRLQAQILPDRMFLGAGVPAAPTTPETMISPAPGPAGFEGSKPVPLPESSSQPLVESNTQPLPESNTQPLVESNTQVLAEPTILPPSDTGQRQEATAPEPLGMNPAQGLPSPWLRYASYLALGLLVLGGLFVLRKRPGKTKRPTETAPSRGAATTQREQMTDMTTVTPRAETRAAYDEPLRETPSLSEADEKLLQGNFSELAMIQGNIQGKDKHVRTIYVTSCFNGEGKTRAVLNMAHGMCINHSRILLIDGNPRTPQLHEKYGISKAPGLMDVLFLGTPPEEAIHETKYRGLHVMPFGQGPPGRPNMLKDRILSDLMDRLKDSYDFLIMDGHSQIGSSDGPLVASIFDGAILVVECEKTKWEVVQEASKKIALLGGKPLGVVLNKRRFYIPRLFYGRK